MPGHVADVPRDSLHALASKNAQRARISYEIGRPEIEGRNPSYSGATAHIYCATNEGST